MNLISNNPDKRAGLTGHDLQIVGRTAINVDIHEDNIKYLQTKRDRMGHTVPGLDEALGATHE